MTEDLFSSTHPQLPPTTEETGFLWLRLLRSRRVGPTTFHRLIAEHGDVTQALQALPEVARAAGEKEYHICPEGVIHAELKAARQFGATLLLYGQAGYPKALLDQPDAPPILWARGNLSLLQQTSIALVGARNASPLGTRMARSLASQLGQKGHVITSGLARGIDAATHHAALKTGTIAVFAGGLDVIYPTENTGLAKDIEQQGLILSEQPMGTQPQARHFPARNRIVSGLSIAVVVVEAAARSGSLITARNALDQGCEVLAVPGHPFDARASGCNMLIRDSATLVRNTDDILEALKPLHQNAEATPERPAIKPRTSDTHSLRDTSALHMQILNRLGPSPLAEDQLIRDLKVPAKRITPVLLDMELEGAIRRQAGGLLCRA